MKNVVIAGGTGHIGTLLSENLVKEGYCVTIFTRKKIRSDHPYIEYVMWNPDALGDWTKYLDNTDVVINLCGKSVDCRYTESNKRKLIDSRVHPTNLLGKAIGNSSNPPKVWINASSSAYYGFSTSIMDETDAAGIDFPATICKEWENAFFKQKTPNTRKVAWRLGVVLQSRKGLILPFVRLAKLFLGEKLGSGKQYFTWIHEKDFLKAGLRTIEDDSILGAINLTSPKPLTNEEFMKAIRDALDIPFAFALPETLLKIGGKIIGTEPYLILDGRRIVPTRLIESGFKFQYPEIQEALNNLFKKSD